jgi:simple sugar transport system permease protein
VSGRAVRLATTWLAPLVAVLIAAIVGDLLILSFGESPGAVYRLLIDGTWGNPYGLGQVLYKATTLTFTGLAVALGLRAGLFNIGAEAQLAAGGFAAAMMGWLIPTGTPALLAVPVCIFAAAAGGGVVGAVPGALKARFGASEVIVTIMLNFVVLAFLNWLVAAKLHVGESLHTPAINAGGLPRLSDVAPAFHGSAANATMIVAVAAAAAVGWYLFRTRAGYDLRAVGLQPDAAQYGGISVGAIHFRALTMAGAVAGIGSCRAPARRRCGGARHGHGRSRRPRAPAAGRRSRCWRASPRPAPARRSRRSRPARGRDPKGRGGRRRRRRHGGYQSPRSAHPPSPRDARLPT